jgi:acyl-CoA synthetase (NDP forming)
MEEYATRRLVETAADEAEETRESAARALQAAARRREMQSKLRSKGVESRETRARADEALTRKAAQVPRPQPSARAPVTACACRVCAHRRPALSVAFF